MSDVAKLKQQLDATNIRLQQMQYQMQNQNRQQAQREEQEEQVHFQQPPQHQQVDPNQQQHQINTIVDHISNQVTQRVQQNQQATNEIQEGVKKRMQRLTADYPALTDEESPLVIKARDVYARINQENPQLDMATKYELAVREAASSLGAKPINAPIEDTIQDFTMPANTNHAVSNRRGGKLRLTNKIVQNAMLLGINCDPKSPDGKKNLQELSDYTERFNADQDESAYRYR